jgi:hypothetical protein
MFFSKVSGGRSGELPPQPVKRMAAAPRAARKRTLLMDAILAKRPVPISSFMYGDLTPNTRVVLVLERVQSDRLWSGCGLFATSGAKGKEFAGEENRDYDSYLSSDYAL